MTANKPVHSPTRASARIIALPTAAALPVVNPSRRGRLPKSIGSIADARRQRWWREAQEQAARVESIRVGQIVRVFHRGSANYGRLATVLQISRYDAKATVQPLGGPFYGADGNMQEKAEIDITWIEPQGAAAIRQFFKRV